MVRTIHDMERRPRCYPVKQRSQQGEVCKLVPGTLKEQHRQSDRCEVLPSLRGVAPCSVKWKTEKREALHRPETPARRGGRCHAPAHRFATSEDGKVGHEGLGRRDSRPDRLHEYRGGIRQPPARLHVGKLVSECCDTMVCQDGCTGLQEFMVHACPGTMTEDVEIPGFRRTQQSSRHDSDRLPYVKLVRRSQSRSRTFRVRSVLPA